jgi:hypothetical protein
MMAEPGFLKIIKEYDKDKTDQKTVDKIQKYTRDEDFQPDTVGKIS